MPDHILQIVAIALLLLVWVLVGLTMMSHERKMNRWEAPKTLLARLYVIIFSVLLMPVFFVPYLYQRDLDRRFPNTPTNR